MYAILLILITTIMQSVTIFDFSKTTNTTNWKIVDDVVMGGKSSGKFYVNQEGNAIFEGNISLENNGGFSSLRYRFDAISTTSYSKIVLKVKGDGKSFQFRVKNKWLDSHSYISFFTSSEDWQTIEFPLSEMYPTFRGRKLNIPNYDGNTIEEVAFLIGNKKEEAFELEIDSILLK